MTSKSDVSSNKNPLEIHAAMQSPVLPVGSEVKSPEGIAKFLIRYLVFLALITVLISPLFVLDGHPLFEVAVRSWMLNIVLVAGPASRSEVKWFWRLPIVTATVGALFVCTTALYSFHHYSPTNNVSTGWLLIYIIYAVAVAWGADSISKRLVQRKFLRPTPTAEN